jgi:hypothetical protein
MFTIALDDGNWFLVRQAGGLVYRRKTRSAATFMQQFVCNQAISLDRIETFGQHRKL